MTKTFLTCTNCGQRSSDTKRCRNCGQVFGRPPQQADDSSTQRNWLPFLIVFGVAAVIALGLQQWWQRPPVAPTVTVPETTATVPETTVVAAPAETAVVSTPTRPAPTPPVQKEIPPAQPVDTPRTVAPSAPTVTFDPARQRYATTWANVRAERNSGATVLQVLDRGEIVAIDSLEAGWYRVTTDRPVVGYVDQQYLDTLPPAKP